MKAKDKEPLLDVHQFYQKDMSMDIFEMMEQYAKYHTEWHLNNVKEIVCKEADTTQKECHYTGVRAGGSYFVSIVDKQSITNAVDKYINENL